MQIDKQSNISRQERYVYSFCRLVFVSPEIASAYTKQIVSAVKKDPRSKKMRPEHLDIWYLRYARIILRQLISRHQRLEHFQLKQIKIDFINSSFEDLELIVFGVWLGLGRDVISKILNIDPDIITQRLELTLNQYKSQFEIQLARSISDQETYTILAALRNAFMQEYLAMAGLDHGNLTRLHPLSVGFTAKDKSQPQSLTQPQSLSQAQFLSQTQLSMLSKKTIVNMIIINIIIVLLFGLVIFGVRMLSRENDSETDVNVSAGIGVEPDSYPVSKYNTQLDKFEYTSKLNGYSFLYDQTFGELDVNIKSEDCYDGQVYREDLYFQSKKNWAIWINSCGMPEFDSDSIESFSVFSKTGLQFSVNNVSGTESESKRVVAVLVNGNVQVRSLYIFVDYQEYQKEEVIADLEELLYSFQLENSKSQRGF